MREIIAQERAVEREKARIEKGKRDGEKFVNTSEWTAQYFTQSPTEGEDVTTDGVTSRFLSHIPGSIAFSAPS